MVKIIIIILSLFAFCSAQVDSTLAQDTTIVSRPDTSSSHWYFDDYSAAIFICIFITVSVVVAAHGAVREKRKE